MSPTNGLGSSAGSRRRATRLLEDQIALRDHEVYVPRLVRRAGQPSGTPLELRSDATYLVTGGLRIDRTGDRRIPGRARRQASGADQPTRAERCRAAAHRRAQRTARLRIPRRRCRCRRCARRRTPVGRRAGRATAIGRHRPCRRRDRHHPAERPGRRRSRSRLRREGLGCLAFERSGRRPEPRLLRQHLVDRLGMGRIRSDRLRRGQRLPRRVGLASARAGHPRDQRQFRSLVGGHGRRRVAGATGQARGPDVVTCRCAGGSGRRHGGP